MKVFLLLSALVYLLLGLAWSKNNFLNFTIKCLFFCLFIVSIYFLMKENGYIINISNEKLNC